VGGYLAEELRKWVGDSPRGSFGSELAREGEVGALLPHLVGVRVRVGVGVGVGVGAGVRARVRLGSGLG
jgi:hypothetical protein